MKKFLVTGGAGFIGSHIAEALVAKGHFVRILDNFSSGKRENLSFTRKKLFPHRSDTIEAKETVSDFISNFDLIEGDIRDKSACDQACSGMDFVLHQAALRSVPKSLLNHKDYNDVNINGTLNMLQAARENKVKCFVLASSSSIYGEATKFPEKETDTPKLISPYALSKLAGEYYCKIFSKHFKLNTVALRYFNVFGPRQSLDDEYAVVIPKFITCMLRCEKPPIYGTGRQSRDFTYISNVVEANILAAKKGSLSGEVFNVASGRDYSVLDLVKILNKLMGSKIKPLFLPLRPGDVFRTNASLSKIKKGLGFRPRVDFESGLELTLRWFSRQAL